MNTPNPYRDGSLGAVVHAYLRHADEYYGESREGQNLRATLGRLLRSRAELAVDEFDPVELKAWRAELIDERLSRGYCNRAVKHARRCLRWAVEERLASPATLALLESVAPLKRGRSRAMETGDVAPADPRDVRATIPLISQPIRDLVELLRLTGARTGELRIMRTRDLDRSREGAWSYRPRTHKTEYRGKDRVIWLDEPCIELVERHWLPFVADAPVFRSQRGGGAEFAESSIGQAVRNACDRAGVPRWRPHQLRHLYLTTVREATGGDVEACRAAAGHAHIRTTEIYARADAGRALDAMRKVRQHERQST